MKNFAELVTTRRSARIFTGEPVSPDDVKQMMRAALMAPTSKNSRAWQFVLVEDKEMLQRLAAAKPTGAGLIADCTLAVVVTTDAQASEAPIEDGAIAATYIQLQAEDLGLGTCWVHVRQRSTADGSDSEQYVRELLGIPAQNIVSSIVAIGHRAKEAKPHSDEKLEWEKVHIASF